MKCVTNTVHWHAQCLLCGGLNGLQISNSTSKADTISSQKNLQDLMLTAIKKLNTNKYKKIIEIN